MGISNKTRKKIQEETNEYIINNEHIKYIPAFYKYNIDSFKDISEIDLKKRDRTIETKLEIVNEDCIDLLIRYQKETCKKFCLAVYGDEIKPGGTYLTGTKRQESEVARRTNISLVYNRIKYPLEINGGIFGKNIIIFRDNENNNYNFLEEEIICDCVIVGMPKNPCLENSKYSSDDSMKIRGKFMAMFDECLKRNSKNLILGAFGCGKYNNPPDHIAMILKELITSYRYKNRFERIIFAIKENGNEKNDIFFDYIMTDSI